MSELKYTEDHEWVRLEDDGDVTIGISNYAQEQLGDVVYVELPVLESVVGNGDEISVVESVKTAGEIKAPISGTITVINERLTDEPEMVNTDPMGDGWFFKMKPDELGELDQYMSESDYEEFVKGL